MSGGRVEQIVLAAPDCPPRGWRPSRMSIRTKEPSQKYLGEAALKHDKELQRRAAEENARQEAAKQERIEKLAAEVAQCEQKDTETQKAKPPLRAKTVKAKLRRLKGDRRPKRREVWTGPRLSTLRCYCSTWRTGHSPYGKVNKTKLMERAAKHLGLTVKTCMRAADYYRLWPGKN